MMVALDNQVPEHHGNRRITLTRAPHLPNTTMSQQEASKQQSPAPKRSAASSQMTPIFPKDAGKRAVPVVVASTTSVPLPEEAVTMAGATTETTDVDTPTVTATSVVVPSTVVAPPPRGPGHHVQFKLDFNMLVQKGIMIVAWLWLIACLIAHRYRHPIYCYTLGTTTPTN